MTKMFTLSSRFIIGTCCALLLCGTIALLSWDTTAHAQNSNAQAEKPKKKLPPGAHGFEQYAGRDASDKLVTGGATRGGPEPGVPENVAKAEDAIKRGGEAYDAGNYDQAAAAFQEAIKAQPDNFKAYFSLGATYEAKGDYQKAAAAYRQAVKLQPNTDKGDSPNDVLFAYYNLGNTLANASDHKAAIDAYMQVVNRVPNLSKPYYNIGLSYAALNDQPKAIEAFKKAVDLMPSFELAWYNLGLSYSKNEQYAEAIGAFKKAIEIDPTHAEAHYNLGLVYYMMDNRQGLLAEQKALQASKPELAKELAKLLSQ
jgi:tetratricopeptide (TPR) repeat protein